MSNVIPFLPKPELAAQAVLNEFIHWAKSNIHLYDKPLDCVQWAAKSWHRWGFENTTCSKLGKRSELLHPDFIDYAKAMLFEERVIKLRKKNYTLHALRCLEVALLDITQNGDVTAVTAAIFDKACAVAQNYYDASTTVYQVSRELKYVNDHLHALGVVANPFIWEPQIKPFRITLKKSYEVAKKKLPSDKSLIALGEIFHNKPELPLDIMITSAVAIMLSHPCRIGELAYVKKDCFFAERDAQGREQLYMLWYSAKGFGATQKPIPDIMAETCQEAVNRVIEITQEARDYAKWLEENPDSFPRHAGVPNKGLGEPLSTQEACDALMLSTRRVSSRGNKSRKVFKKFLENIVAKKSTSSKARKIAQELLYGFDSSSGTRHYVNGWLAEYEFNDTFKVTLRTLNVLLREKYLPEHFPFTNSKRITKWQDALFCFRTGAFAAVDSNRGTVKPFGLTGCGNARLSLHLTGGSKEIKSIFERHGYNGVKVNTHAFRHYLNTGANRSYLSQELIARWSGRENPSQNKVYNHMSVDEKAAEIEAFTPQLAVMSDKLLASLKTNAPISMKDFGDESDRIVHRTEFGICIHDYAQEPCAKFNNCLTCGEHVCVKGDETKLVNLKEEREYLRSSLEAFQREADEGTYGANTWLQTTMEKMERCDQLIQMLESPDIEDGALIRGVENGWAAGRNALAMRGELVEEDANLIATEDDKVAELERLLGSGG
ncbi:hypothetical protein QLQ85_14495 [Halomonas sp. M4R5S39]|uniref:hypothetical protein n=1 Tax=Halomonas kalidii TaxID=3043293 RepID=UPI0024A8FA63|nr:hypothetical protein [Halomonas kalidii]MDI5986004.1 hypothetical protein [Halomonas kalidii]